MFGKTSYNNHSYTGRRLILYVLLWLVSVVVLGLSAWRVTRFNDHKGIVYELLVTSILTIIWVPIAMFLLMATRAASAVTGNRHPRWTHEQIGGWPLWLLWLVGASILTNHFPTHASRGFGRPARLLETLIALSWVAFGLLTLIGILAWMHHAHTRDRTGAASKQGYAYHDGVTADNNMSGTTRSTVPAV